MKKFPAVLAATVLGAAGFAAAGIAGGTGLLHALTGTTTTVATTTTTATGQGGRRVTICHHTGSRKHPLQTITVSQSAVRAHVRHHDTLGACQPPTAGATTTTSATSDDASKGHGNGKGHGKP